MKDPSPPLGSPAWLYFGRAVGIRGMLWETGRLSHAAFLPLTLPRAVREVRGQDFRFGFRSPKQSPHNFLQSPHLGAGRARVPIIVWVSVP